MKKDHQEDNYTIEVQIEITWGCREVEQILWSETVVFI